MSHAATVGTTGGLEFQLPPLELLLVSSQPVSLSVVQDKNHDKGHLAVSWLRWGALGTLLTHFSLLRGELVPAEELCPTH